MATLVLSALRGRCGTLPPISVPVLVEATGMALPASLVLVDRLGTVNLAPAPVRAVPHGMAWLVLLVPMVNRGVRLPTVVPVPLGLTGTATHA
jgi:hypothetical protein